MITGRADPWGRALDGATVFWTAVGLSIAAYFAGMIFGGGIIWFATRPLAWFATTVHELGHGIAAMAIGADFRRLEMWSDGSGHAITSGADGAMHALVSAGGLVGPSIAAAAGFAAARSGRWVRVALYLFAGVLAWALIFKVRNLFGAGFVAALAVTAAAVGAFASTRSAQLVVMFVSVQLALSLWSQLDYMFSDVAETAGGRLPSDSARMADALAGPYWLWGSVCAAISLGALLFGAWVALRNGRARVA